MGSTFIGTRNDLDAIVGTAEHASFMNALSGTLWRLEKDDDAGAWRAVEDDSAIKRFGFNRADFPGAVAPALPAYVVPSLSIPAAVTMRQARLALAKLNLLDAVNSAVDGIAGDAGVAARIEWEFAQEVRRDSLLVMLLAPSIGLDQSATDELFIAAAAL